MDEWSGDYAMEREGLSVCGPRLAAREEVLGLQSLASAIKKEERLQ